jgi:gentisate 1,2-dioxygenase
MCGIIVATYRHINNSKRLRGLTYSNAALLEMMRVHLVEDDPQPAPPHVERAAHPTMELPTFQIGDDGAALMPYETLINPPAVESRVLYYRGKP